MEALISKINIYMLPPFLFLVAGVTLAGISIIKGKLERENIYFSLVCVWWTLLAPAFLTHHLVESEDMILRIERGLHFFYVFIPFVNLVFFHYIMGLRRRPLEITALVTSILIALSTPTDLYFNGLYRFQWGYIAKGGPAFQVFGAYSFIVLVYGTVLTIKGLITEKNHITRLKIKYIVISLVISGILTTTNIPAINGIDFYPLGNFMFIPLGIMAYGVLRYRIMEVRSIFHITIFWAATSSLIVIPNALLFIFLGPRTASLEPLARFALLGAWFFLNYYYLRKIQPLINQLFNRRKYNLRKIESEFINGISYLKTLKALRDEFTDILKKALNVKFAELCLQYGESDMYIGDNPSEGIKIDPDIREWFIGADHAAEKNMVATNPYYKYIREKLMALFDERKCGYIVPFVQNNELMAILFLGEKANLKQLSPDEITFVNSTRAAASIALANSFMYQNLSNMKDHLEDLVKERTGELQKKNEQMLFELKVAKNVQQTILPSNLPYGEDLQVAARIIPLMEVSGDFYDVVRMGDDRLAIIIVDVSGHGVPSALLTSMIKTEINNLLKTENGTAGVCSLLNQNLRQTLSETGFYFTMILGMIDLSKMEMEFSNCGHTNPLILRAGGETEVITTEGFFIGTLLDASYESSRIPLAPGDRIFFYTDGLTEVRDSQGRSLDDSGFIRLVKETWKLPVKEQLNEILVRVAEFHKGSEGGSRDDITLMITGIGTHLQGTGAGGEG